VRVASRRTGNRRRRGRRRRGSRRRNASRAPPRPDEAAGPSRRTRSPGAPMRASSVNAGVVARASAPRASSRTPYRTAREVSRRRRRRAVIAWERQGAPPCAAWRHVGTRRARMRRARRVASRGESTSARSTSARLPTPKDVPPAAAPRRGRRAVASDATPRRSHARGERRRGSGCACRRAARVLAHAVPNRTRSPPSPTPTRGDRMGAPRRASVRGLATRRDAPRADARCVSRRVARTIDVGAVDVGAAPDAETRPARRRAPTRPPGRRVGRDAPALPCARRASTRELLRVPTCGARPRARRIEPHAKSAVADADAR
jgi:hypothetical protein